MEIAVLFIAILPLIMVVLVVRQLSKAKWTLLETLIATFLLGHVIVVPTVLAYRDGERTDHQFALTFLVCALSTASAMIMAYGTFWIFRCLRSIGEQRPAVRIGYMVLGMLSFPTIVIPPVAMLIWWPLLRLYRKARTVDPTSPRIDIFESK